jgi:hypothetical protein
MDLGLQEIADRLDITESAVRSRLHRARSRLRTLLTARDLAPFESASLPPKEKRRAIPRAVAAAHVAA